MKKYFIIFLFLAVFLSACQKNDTIQMEFDQVVSKFSQQIDYFLLNINNLGFDDAKATQTNLYLKWENKDFKLDSKIFLSGYFDYTNNNYDIKSNPYIYFWDKKEQKENSFSGNIDYKKTQNQLFVKTNNVFVDMWSWNYQTNLMSMISKNLEDKRISLDQDKNNIFLTHKDIKFLLKSIVELEIFYSTQVVKYESNLAYKVQIKPEMLQYLNQNLSFKIDQFEGLLIVSPNSEIQLKLDNLSIFWKQNIKIKWEIWNQKGFLDIKNINNEHINNHFSWDTTKNQHNYIYKRLSNYQEIIKLNLNLNNKIVDNLIKNKIYGDIKISPQIIYWSDLEKEIKIDINGEQKSYDYKRYDIKAPDSYIFFNQILWDDFSLTKIMSE